MGLFSFLKKKESDVSNQKPMDLNSLNTDLPDIDGSRLDELKLPSLDDSLEQSNGQELSSFDSSKSGQGFSAPDEIEHTGGYHDNSFHGLPDDISTDMNQLFLSDPEWKEPDWNNFEPYNEDHIEPPTMHDFGMDLPSENPADKISLPENSTGNAQYVVPEFNDVEPQEHHVPDDVPYDVFVRGVDYSRVFKEMDDVKKILVIQDDKMSQVLEKFKEEELTIDSCKANMEILYKKMLMIDKKVFA